MDTKTIESSKHLCSKIDRYGKVLLTYDNSHMLHKHMTVVVQHVSRDVMLNTQGIHSNLSWELLEIVNPRKYPILIPVGLCLHETKPSPYSNRLLATFKIECVPIMDIKLCNICSFRELYKYISGLAIDIALMLNGKTHSGNPDPVCI